MCFLFDLFHMRVRLDYMTSTKIRRYVCQDHPVIEDIGGENVDPMIS